MAVKLQSDVGPRGWMAQDGGSASTETPERMLLQLLFPQFSVSLALPLSLALPDERAPPERPSFCLSLLLTQIVMDCYIHGPSSKGKLGFEGNVGLVGHGYWVNGQNIISVIHV